MYRQWARHPDTMASLRDFLAPYATTFADLIVQATNTFGVRSSHRTDPIHQYLSKRIEELNPRVDVKVEYAVKTTLGMFDVDIVVFNKETGAILACILFKSLNSSISKNEKNYEHNKIGEAVKLGRGEAEKAKVVFMDMIPIRCPTYGAGDTIKGWEKHDVETVRARSKLVVDEINHYHTYVHDAYVLFNDYDYLPGKKIALKEVVDHSDMARFEEMIKSLAPVAETSP